MISEMSSAKKGAKAATPSTSKGPASKLECNFVDCTKKYKTITGLVKHQKSCHNLTVDDEVIAKYKTEAKNLNIELEDSNLELNLSETLLKQVPQSSQKDDDQKEVINEEGKGKKRGRGVSMLDEEDEENKRLKEEIDNLPFETASEPIDSAILDDTVDPNEEKVTDTQAERDQLFSNIMGTQAVATTET